MILRHLGDFSFALSLVRNHVPCHIVATCYDSEETLHQKYPQASSNIQRLLQGLATIGWPQLAGMGGRPAADGDTGRQGHSSCSVQSSVSPSSPVRDGIHGIGHRTSVEVRYGIDASKLSSTHSRVFRPYLPFTKIVFNFPHVGGLSTDVNRQVRSNQELLVGFFKSAIPLLASSSSPLVPHPDPDGTDDEAMYDCGAMDQVDTVVPTPITKGQILVTLFEGEPYSLWNIRDLARHCGLKVVESYRFPWEAYPGYQHARTIGEIVSGRGNMDVGKRKGAWKGEERESRCFVLEVKDEEGVIEGFATGGNVTMMKKTIKKKTKSGQVTDSDSD